MIASSTRALLLSLLLCTGPALAATPMLVIHGGAGVEKSSLSPDEQTQAREAMQHALRA
ncbi:isoaspartyl peptidase/L-asparaginase, partial [Xanthomonas axonopodis pv. ricini]